LIARARLARGDIVAIKGGHIVDSATFTTLDEWLHNSDIQIADGFHIVELDADEYEGVMLSLNHNCASHVGVAGNVVFVALRDIEPGEELTTDYALFDDNEGEMVCGRGQPSCRGLSVAKTGSGRSFRRSTPGTFRSTCSRRFRRSLVK
jgi:hypothetical protein